MKEATGELNMTLVVIVAVAAVMAFAVIFVPRIIKSVNNTWDNQLNTTVQMNWGGNGQQTG
jgi:hypothetical protein